MEHSPSPPAVRKPRLNADYRWTLPKAWAFLEALAESGSVAAAARSVGMSRQSAYRLKARLQGGPLEKGFELSQRKGRLTRAQRQKSRWDGPGLDKVTGRAAK